MNLSEKQFINNIYNFARRKIRLSLFGASFHFITIILGLWLSLVLADHLFYFSEITRWGLLLINILAITGLIKRILKRPFMDWIQFNKEADLCPIAEELPAYFPEGQDGFVIAYQLIKEKNASPQPKNDLAEAAIRKFISGYKTVVFRSRLNWKDWFPSKNLILTIWAAALVLSFTHTHELYRSTRRLLNPGNPYLEIPAFQFEVLPGNTRIIKGESLKVQVRFQGPPISSLNLYRELNGMVQQQKLVRNAGLYTADLKDLHNDFEYWVRAIPEENGALAEYLKSKTYQVQIQIPPQVVQLDLKVEAPAYTKLEPLTLDRNIGDVLAYPGSKVYVHAQANKPIVKGQLEFASAGTKTLQLRGNHVNGAFRIEKIDSYKLILKDSSGLLNQNPIDYRISLLEDRPPFVAITEPGADTESPLDGTLPLKIEAEDDFAINRLEVLYRIQRNAPGGDTSWTKRSMKIPKQNLVQSAYILDFNRFPLTFGDTLTYFARAWDNNGFSGPAKAESPKYRVLFPSLDQLFAELDQEQSEEVDALDAVRKESEELRNELEKIERQMNRNSKLDWDKKKSLEKILESQKAMHKKIQEMRQELEEAVHKLEKNNLLSPEIMEKYTRLQEMFQEVLSPELLKSLQDLQQAMEQNQPQDMRQALKKFKLNQEAFEKNIERTMELLKRVQFEQKMDRLVQKAKKLADQQEKISAELETQPQKDIDQQARKMQQQQKQQLDNLNQDAKEFMREDLLEQFPQTEELVDSALAQMQEPLLHKKMDELKKQMNGKKTQQAGQNSKALQKSFKKMQLQLQQAQKNMQLQSKNQIAQKMQRISQNMLDLSFRQEQIQNQTKNMSPLDNNFNQNLKDQGQLLNNFDMILQQIAELSKETFFLPPKMSTNLRAGRSKMQQSIAQLSEREQGNALRSQSEAMKALNQMVMQMAQAMAQMMQAESGTGFEEFMRQMQQMAGQQGQLNDQSLQLMQGQGNSGMFSQREQAEMRRLGRGQSALRQALDQMAQEMGQRDDILGELGQIAKDMELVEQDLLKAQPDRHTIERQRRILSRMLDSQKSLEQREFSKKRKSKTGRQYITRDPGDQGSGLLEDKKRIEEALRSARKQGYSREYQKLIELYFEKLLRSPLNDKQ